MQTYDDKPINEISWTKYKIIVPTEEDKQELEAAFEHFHYADIDTNYVTVNQLAHEYLTPERSGDPRTKNNIIVDPELFKKLQQTDIEQKNITLYETFEETFQVLEENGYIFPHDREAIFLDVKNFFEAESIDGLKDELFLEANHKMKTFHVITKRTKI